MAQTTKKKATKRKTTAARSAQKTSASSTRRGATSSSKRSAAASSTRRSSSGSSRTRQATARAKSTSRASERRIRPIPLIAALTALVIVTSFIATRCSSAGSIVAHQLHPQGTLMAVPSRTELYTSPLDWNNIIVTNAGYKAYYADGEVQSKLGIDVSEHNADIDWKQVKDAGIEFVYLRIGYRGSEAGNIVIDPNFEQNLAGAQEAGLEIGVYFFSQAITEVEAREEADFIATTLGEATLDYPVAFDMEPDAQGADRISELTNDQMTAIASAFCRQCANNGYNAVVYGNQYDLIQYRLDELMPYGFWYAEYTDLPTMNLNFNMWQYSHTGTVPGIEGNVDINLDLTEALVKARAKIAAAEADVETEAESSQ